MATLSIREYEHLAALSGGTLQVGQELANTSQAVAISAGSLQSVAFNIRTRHIRVHTDAQCSIEFGLNPTATITSCVLSAQQTEYFGVRPGDKLAVIVVP
jgi:hypothetical protein